MSVSRREGHEEARPYTACPRRVEPVLPRPFSDCRLCAEVARLPFLLSGAGRERNQGLLEETGPE